MKDIDAYLKNQVDAHLSPSIQYTFFDTEATIHQMRYGLKNVKAKEPIDSSTTYNLFSITKTVTALSVLQLVEAGRIELTMPLSSYLPEFPYSKKITVEQLLSHTSGIPNPPCRRTCAF
jgi:D-alanyl-D-alanine carboxypeptidase